MDNENYKFYLTIDSKKVAVFSEVYSDDLTMEPIEHRQGTTEANNNAKIQLLNKHRNITFKNGVIYDIDFLHWIVNSVREFGNKMTITICLCDDVLQQNVEWKVINAYPVKYEGIDLREEEKNRTIQKIEFIYEDLERI